MLGCGNSKFSEDVRAWPLIWKKEESPYKCRCGTMGIRTSLTWMFVLSFVWLVHFLNLHSGPFSRSLYAAYSFP